MTTKLEDIEALFDAVKTLRDERRKMEKLSLKVAGMEGKRAAKGKADLDWSAFNIARAEHRAHAAAVDAGIAEPLPRAEYEPYSVKLNGFQEYRVQPDRPKALAASDWQCPISHEGCTRNCGSYGCGN